MDEPHVTAPAGSHSPLFEPERSPPPPYMQPSMPSAAMIDADAPAPAAIHELAEKAAHGFILHLKKLEADAQDEIATWPPDQLHQPNEKPNTESVNSLKRKGMAWLLFHEQPLIKA